MGAMGAMGTMGTMRTMRSEKTGRMRKADGLYRDIDTGRTWEHKHYATRIYWTGQMLSDLRRLYPTTKNEMVAEVCGVSVRTMIRKARELGLQKDEAWLHGVWDDHRKMAHMAGRAKGYPGCFKKGVRQSPATEFKKGHKESDESKAKRGAAVRRLNDAHRSELRERGLRAWETRKRRLEGFTI